MKLDLNSAACVRWNVGIVSKLTVSDDLTHFDFYFGKYLLILFRKGRRRALTRKAKDQTPSLLAQALPISAIKISSISRRPHASSLTCLAWHQNPFSTPSSLAWHCQKARQEVHGCCLRGKWQEKINLILCLSLNIIFLLPSLLSFLVSMVHYLLISNPRPFFVFGRGSSFIVC